MARLYKRGKYWWFDITRDGKRYHKSLKTTDKKIAREKCQFIERQLILGQFKKDDKIAISRAYKEYIQDISATRRPKTIIDKKSRLNKLIEFWKNHNIIYLQDITSQSITEFRSEFMSGKITSRENPHPATYNHYLKNAKAFINWVIKHRPEYLAVNPIRYSERIPNAYIRKFRYFTKDEIKRVYEKVDDPLDLAFFKLLANTGCRLSELRYLEWKNVNLEDGVIEIVNKPEYDWMVKTYQERTIPLNDAAISIFKTLSEKQSFVFPMKGIWYWSRHFRKALRAAGIVDKRLADLRHTFGAHHALANTNPFVIQRMMGHSDISTTQIYVNLRNDDIKDLANNINL